MANVEQDKEVVEGCSPTVQFPHQTEHWTDIQTALLTLTQPAEDLTVTAGHLRKLYCAQCPGLQDPVTDVNKTPYSGLVHYFSTHAQTRDAYVFMKSTLPCIANLVLAAEQLVPTEGVRVSVQQHGGPTQVSRKMAAAIVATAFLCLFPEHQRSSQLPYINSTSFFDLLKRRQGRSSQQAKLQCILHYFQCLAEKDCVVPGDITFHRVVLSDEDLLKKEDLLLSTHRLCPLAVQADGGIEQAGSKVLQVDFANRFLGGSVLTHGSTQEEIRFSVSPELISGALFTECLAPNEALIITGFEQYSAYTGYSKSFKFAGNFNDTSERDAEGNILTSLCAIDAVPYRACKGNGQFEEHQYMRDINKAYAGFLQPFVANRDPEKVIVGEDKSWMSELNPHKVRAVATGNWGCGCYGGNAQFKALLQWLAASVAGCPAMIYYTYNDPSVRNLPEVADKVHTAGWTVGDLMTCVDKVSSDILAEFAQKEDGILNLLTLWRLC